MLTSPKHYELWADLSHQNRHLRRNNWLHWGVHLVLVFFVVAMAYRPLTAVRVDSLGHASLVDAVQPVNQPGPEEAQHVTQLTAQYLLEVTSGSVQRDITKGMGLMTATFSRAYREKVRDDASLPMLEKGNVRTQLTFDNSSTEVKAQKDETGRVTRYFVTQLARLDVYRADVLTSPVFTRPVVIRTTLLVVPRSRATLNGLLVDFFEKEFLEDKKHANVVDHPNATTGEAVIALVLSIAAAPAAKPAKPDAGVPQFSTTLEQAGEVEEIELDEKRARAVYRIHTAISIPAVVEFPESFVAPPACGDCADAAKPGKSSALFALQAEPSGNILIVKPRLYPGPQEDGSSIQASDFVTTITVRLQSLTLTLQVELTEDKKQADARVRFVLPNRAAESRFVTEAIGKAKAQMESEFASRVEQSAADQLLRSFLEPHECRSNSARSRDADMVVELRELCRFGKRIYVRFALENRGRSLFVLGDVGAGVGDGKAFTAVETKSLLSLAEVAFQQTAEGIVSFDVEDASRTFELRLAEKGGRTRTVALQGFSF